MHKLTKKIMLACVVLTPQISLSDDRNLIYADPFSSFVDGYNDRASASSGKFNQSSPLEGVWKTVSLCPDEVLGKISLRYAGNGIFFFNYKTKSGSIGYGQIVQNRQNLDFTILFKNGSQASGYLRIDSDGNTMRGEDNSGCKILANR